MHEYFLFFGHAASDRFTYDEEGGNIGYENFMSLEELHDASKGYIVNDTLIVEIVFSAISVTEFFS